VVERALCPDDCVVAHVACGRKPELDMVHGRGGVVVVGLMASNASRAGQVVIVVHVARGAGHGGVRAGERPSRCCVVECNRQP